MFTRYWRTYPWPLQVALFLLMVFTMASFSVVLAYLLVPRITGVPLDQLAGLHAGSSRQIVNAALLGQFISTVITFMASAGVFAYVTHPRPAYYLGLRAPGKNVQIILIVIMMAGFTPLILEMEGVMRMIDLGANIKASQKEHDDIFSAFLSMPNVSYFIIGLVVMGITPAISEELVFRGVIMRFVQKRATGIATPIFVSALLFALIHMDVYGFIPIFISGVFLGMVYYLTGSLWCSMLAHALHNSIQVTMMYASQNNASIKAVIEGNSVPVYVLGPAVVLFAGCLYLLWKNRTPLPPNWTSDFNDPKPTQLNTFSEN